LFLRFASEGSKVLCLIFDDNEMVGLIC